MAALTIPSQRIDGDFYDFFQHVGQRLDIIVGDVMGKGIPAALLGAATKSHFLEALSQSMSLSDPGRLPEPKEIVTLAHATLARHLISLESFVTVCYTRFDLPRRRVDLVDCGHTTTIHYQQRTGTCALLRGDNLPLGFSEREIYDQITAAETLGVEHRGGYYEEAGCLRDMFQNHLFQLLALVAMEPPVRSHGQSVRDRKADVLRSVVPINRQQVSTAAVRGQYGPGEIKGIRVPAYREEVDIAPQSHAETFAALELAIDNWRWANVPFFLRSGKRLPQKLTLITIEFKQVPHLFFQDTPQDQTEPNVLTIRIQPDEGISLKLGAKATGPGMHIRQMLMNFSYGDAFGEFPATAYETLLLDAMQGDPTLFNRNDAVELSWQILEPVLEAWVTAPATPFPNYPAGSWGPAEADALLGHDGRTWKNASALTKFSPIEDGA